MFESKDLYGGLFQDGNQTPKILLWIKGPWAYDTENIKA